MRRQNNKAKGTSVAAKKNKEPRKPRMKEPARGRLVLPGGDRRKEEATFIAPLTTTSLRSKGGAHGRRNDTTRLRRITASDKVWASSAAGDLKLLLIDRHAGGNGEGQAAMNSRTGGSAATASRNRTA